VTKPEEHSIAGARERKVKEARGKPVFADGGRGVEGGADRESRRGKGNRHR